MLSESLRITEIFYSLQGETRTVGLPTVFVRLTGCPLRCQYCDTAYAFNGGKMMALAQIIEKVSSFPAKYVTVTGGEPLAQPNALPLLKTLCDKGYEVSLETSGAILIDQVDPRVVKILDLKTPASNESQRNLYQNVRFLNSQDQVKFVICDRQDYDWAKFKVDELALNECAGEILFSPSSGELAASELAQWILDDGINVRLQIQLHKLLWQDAQGR